MPRSERFTFLCNKDERHIIALLADRLQRSRSDAIRFLLVSVARELAHQGSPQEAETHREIRGAADDS